MTASNSFLKKIQELRTIIHYHNKKYYVDSVPEISDFEFDQLMKRLVELEARYPECFDPNSPSQRVGGEPSQGFISVEHKIPMKSLGNTYSSKDLIDFDKKVKKNLTQGKIESPINIEYVVELKVDGVSISLKYDTGKLVQGITRGDGYRGDNVTNNIKTIRSIPLVLNKPVTLEVRGEIFFPLSYFKLFNKSRSEQGGKLFANPRNATSGSLKLLDPNEVAKRPLDALFYSIPVGAIDKNTLQQTIPPTHYERLALLKELGFKTNPHIILLHTIGEVIDYITSWETKRETLDYETDGMVIKVNSIVSQEKLGYTSKEPRWAISYKYPANQMTTKIKAIDLSVGRLGTVTPVAVLDAVFLSGTTVQHASLHNFDEIKRKDIRIGDTVFVEKGGEIIPQVIGVVVSQRPQNSQLFNIPTHCPNCDFLLVKDEKEVALRCINLSCPAQIKRKIEYFASKSGLDIEGLGESIVEQLVEERLLKDYADIFYLNEDQLIPLEGFGEKSAEKLIQTINKSKDTLLHRLIAALGIKHIGEKAARVLANQFYSIKSVQSASFESLTEIHEIGPTMANSIIQFFKESHNQNILSKLENAGVNLKSVIDKSVSPKEVSFFKNKKFVLTGNLSLFTRKEAEEKIISLGGRCSSAVSSKTDYLIAGEKAGSKLQKANKLNIPILTETELINKLNEYS